MWCNCHFFRGGVVELLGRGIGGAQVDGSSLSEGGYFSTLCVCVCVWCYRVVYLHIYMCVIWGVDSLLTVSCYR